MMFSYRWHFYLDVSATNSRPRRPFGPFIDYSYPIPYSGKVLTERFHVPVKYPSCFLLHTAFLANYLHAAAVLATALFTATVTAALFAAAFSTSFFSTALGFIGLLVNSG